MHTVERHCPLCGPAPCRYSLTPLNVLRSAANFFLFPFSILVNLGLGGGVFGPIVSLTRPITRVCLRCGCRYQGALLTHGLTQCPDCSYDLRGSDYQFCPECGWRLSKPNGGNEVT